MPTISTCRLCWPNDLPPPPDVLRELLCPFIHALMGAEADALCGAGYGERSAERSNSRNGYRQR